MKILLAPSVALMQRLRLLPKFALVSLLFLIPLMLTMSLLYAELHRSVATAERERAGLRYVRELQDLMRLAQKHRALRHMQLTGNAGAEGPAAQLREAINAKIAVVETIDAGSSGFGVRDAWTSIHDAWIALEKAIPHANAKESYAAHAALIEQMRRLNALVADRSGMTLDPGVDSYHLTSVLVHGLPGIGDLLWQIAGRGAAYIDTGLLEPNEDMMLNSSVMVARRDLARIPEQFDAVFRENPALRAHLEPHLASIPAALAFLDRAQDEVLKSFNQTSGSDFFGAGSESVDSLQGGANAAAVVLDALLDERIARDSTRLALIVALALGGLAVTTYLLAGFYLSFSREVTALERAVERVAAGDLSQCISSAAQDEIGGLVNAFGKMNAGLAQLVAQVRSGSETIAQASRDLASDNADLSARTEAQASSLQQTAASMEELTSTVQQNNANAAQANRLALSAAEVAREGGRAVGEVIDAMDAIKQSSGRIIDIIHVIDGIAFQTNILALNAAVEAARAGNQGRGFAVVAGEVRALSQRAAGSAREIKELIENSVHQVERGNTAVAAAGATIDQIVDSVQHVASIMNDITASSREQTGGIEQANQSLADMDEITQRNALLVEHAATAAASLQDQASTLSQAVAVFKLSPAAAADANTPVPEATTRKPTARLLTFGKVDTPGRPGDVMLPHPRIEKRA